MTIKVYQKANHIYFAQIAGLRYSEETTDFVHGVDINFNLIKSNS